MGIFARTTGSMHNLTILVLAILISFASYQLQIFPYSVVIALVATLAFDLLMVKFYRGHKLKIPYSGIITALIIGSVVPQNSPALLVVAASAIAVVSTFVIRTRTGNIFNPAALGMLIALLAFSTGDIWWASAAGIETYGFIVPLGLILMLAAYEAKRLLLSVCFIATSFAIAIFAGGSFSVGGALASLLLGVNWFFAFIMLPEPKTSPHKAAAQVAYGIGTAVIVAIFAFVRLPNAALFALLAANLCYFGYRRFLQ